MDYTLGISSPAAGMPTWVPVERNSGDVFLLAVGLDMAF